MTSALDCAGGFLNYPDDYGVIQALNKRGEQTVRIGYQLFAQRPGLELMILSGGMTSSNLMKGMIFKCVGAGEMLVASAYDFGIFLTPADLA